jgi:carbonic anhydrase
VAGPERATPHFKTHTGVDPAKALGWMKNGNKRFVKGYLRRDGQSKKDIQRLVNGQKPHTIVLSCSDSRVPPEVVFDQKLGEIFTIRVAGEALDENVIGSVEYAIEHLGVRLVLVMGHTSCAAVRAALGTLKGGDTGTPSLNAMVADLHPRLQSFIDKPQTADLGVESMANAEGIVGDLVKRSSLIREAYDGGDIDIRPALYDLKSGVVTVK